MLHLSLQSHHAAFFFVTVSYEKANLFLLPASVLTYTEKCCALAPETDGQFYVCGENDAVIKCSSSLFKQCQGIWYSCFCLLAEVEGLQVTVPEKKKVAMLFQPALLRCHFSTSSTQPAVVQWRYKSYCQDRMGEALGMVTSGLQTMSKRNLDWDPYLDCVDSRRTVRVVASKQGSAITIGDFYKERDVSIVHGNSPTLGVPGGGWNGPLAIWDTGVWHELFSWLLEKALGRELMYLGFSQPTLDPKVISFGTSLQLTPPRSSIQIQYPFFPSLKWKLFITDFCILLCI